MKTAHTAAVAAALIAALFVAWKAPGLVIESPKAQTRDLAAPLSPAPEQNRRLVPRITSLTSTALISRFASPADPLSETVLIGRTRVEDMIIQLELEPAKGMWMKMGNPSTWMEHPVGPEELFHVEVKPIDPKSKTRISYADVKFAAVNKDNGQKVEGQLHPMWGGSGLHYAMNSGLAGDGAYEATVTVDAPTFARVLKDKDRWMRPISTTFYFRLADGKLTEVSEPMD